MLAEIMAKWRRVALLSDGDETYIVAPVAEDEGGSFIDVEGEAVAAADLVEDLGAGEVEEKIVIEPDPQSPYLDSSLPAGELSFEGSSVGVMFDFSSGDGTFDDGVAGLVFRHGADVSVELVEKGEEPGTSEFVVKDVVDATGGGGNDILTGDSGGNKLSGGGGADTLKGGGGIDTLRGGAEADTLYGGGADDFLEGDAGIDTYVFEGIYGADTIREDTDGGKLYFRSATGLGDIVFSRDANNDVVISIGDNSVTIEGYAEGRYSIHYGSGDTALGKLSLGTTGDDPLLTGTDGADLLLGLGGVDILRGGDGADTLYGGAGEDELYGGGGIDTLQGGAEADTLDGGGGKDIASYAGSSKGVRVSLLLQGQKQQDFTTEHGFTANQGGDAVGDILTSIENIEGSIFNDWLTGDGADNEIRGFNGNDRLEGGAGDDELYGGGGDDTLDGGAGKDILDGGAGTNSASYRQSSQGVRVSLSNTGAQADFTSEHGFTANNNEAKGDILSNIESIYGSANNDWLTGDGEDNTLFGGDGNDRLEGGTGVDTYVFAAGGGTDTDTVVDNGGKIVFDQGTGNGSYVGATYTFTRPDSSSEAVTLTVRDSADNIINVIEFTTYPSSGYDFYTRSGGTNNAIPASSLVVPPRVAGDGSELVPFLATAAAEIIGGSAGADWVSYEESDAKVNIDLSDNPARVNYGWAAGDVLTNINNVIGSDAVSGGLDDTLVGNANANILRGGKGDDTLDGGGGDDTLYGGMGSDILEGGADEDTYVFESGGGTDTVIDNGGNIVFDQGAGNAYTGADYTFTRVDISGEAVTLTVKDSGGNRLNVLEFASDPSLGYSFYTYDGGTNTAIPASELVVPPRGDGSESNPFLATADADSFSGTGNDGWVSYEGATSEIMRFLDSTNLNKGWADGDTLLYIENIIGSSNYKNYLSGDSDANTFRGGDVDDILKGRVGDDTLEGGAGNDLLDGGAGADTLYGGTGTDIYVIHVGDGLDTIHDVAGDIMILQFNYVSYKGTDFTDTNNFNRVGNNLEITIDKNTGDGITDKIIILDAYDNDPNTGKGNSAFTINIEYGVGTLTEVADAMNFGIT